MSKVYGCHGIYTSLDCLIHCGSAVLNDLFTLTQITYAAVTVKMPNVKDELST